MTVLGYPMDGWTIAAIALGLAGAVLLVIAVRGDRARGRRRCPTCWYAMDGVPGLTCPECGREARSERQLHRTRRRWRLSLLAALLLAGSGGGFAAGVASRDGVWALVPFSLGVHILPWHEQVPQTLADQLRARLDEGPIREWQRRHLFARAGVILEDPAKSNTFKMLAMRLIEGVAWRGGYNGVATGEGGDAVPTLIASLDDPDPAVRKFAAGLLGSIGGDLDAALAAVAPMMDTDPDPEVRLDAVRSVGTLAAASSAAARTDLVERLERAFAQGDATMKALCIESAGKLGRVRPDAIAWLASILASPDAHLVHDACEALRKAGTAAAPASDALARVVAGSNRDLAARAASALAASGAKTPAVHDALLEGAGKFTGNNEVFSAFETLFRDQPGMHVELHAATSSWTAQGRAFAVVYACERGADPANFVHMLEEHIRTSRPGRQDSLMWAGVYRWALVAPTRDVSLVEHLADSDPPRNGMAVWRAALRGRLLGDDKATVDMLLEVLSQDWTNSPWTQSCAADALGFFGEEARRGLPVLREMLKLESWQVGELARDSIQRLTGERPPRQD